ncbi:MAG TPA: M23 family metallopeptidase [Candidatus Limnocylindria bacterium]|nr:M23 family metallopeptidase [Candidatus Limnocylindria bacterium]
MPSHHTNAPHHARPGHHGRSRPLTVLALAAVVGTTALVAGPASAVETPRAPADRDRAVVSPLAPTTDPVIAFERALDRADRRAAIAAAVARQERLAQARERAAQRAEDRARALLANVRASRSALRSAVIRPVAGGYRLTAGFGDRSGLWGSGRHTGQDFACPVGTSVHAVADGIVIAAGFDGAYGNRIEVRHADGTVTTYNHLSSISVPGGRVRAGDVIGRVGSTGNTTGAHLHFEVLQGGSLVDPARWLRARYVAF